jgi:predicted HTH transcriptional regulator
LQNRLNTPRDRIDYFIAVFKEKCFSRKDYLNIFKDISTATASRDLKYGVQNNLFVKEGRKRNTIYQIKEQER